MNHHNDYINKIICGDCIVEMQKFDDGYFDYCITSPPFKEDDVEVIHSTYKDNPFLDRGYKKILLDLINQDENYYRVYTLGEWGKLENLVYRKYRMVDEMPKEYQAMAYGLDFGFVNPSAVVKVCLCEGNEVFVEEKLYRPKMTNPDIIEFFSHQERGDIYADPTELQMIEEIRRADLNIYPADKDVRLGIDLCKRQTLNITKQSVNLTKEIGGYQHKVDSNGNVLEEPVKYNDHLMDAIRYAVFGIVARMGFSTVKSSGDVIEVQVFG